MQQLPSHAILSSRIDPAVFLGPCRKKPSDMQDPCPAHDASVQGQPTSVDPNWGSGGSMYAPSRPKPGVLLADDFAIDRLLERGVVFGACNMALQVQSKMLAGNASVTAEEAAKEWAANVIPGITIIPSGTWGVNRAQEAGCTYCAGG